MSVTTEELRNTQGYAVSELRFLCRQAASQIEHRDRLITDALGRLHAASIPLGMTEAHFNALTISDTCSILAAPKDPA